MQDYKIILTLEAVYDIADTADYIEAVFGTNRADSFQSELKNQMKALENFHLLLSFISSKKPKKKSTF